MGMVIFSSRSLLSHRKKALALSVSTDWKGLEAANTSGARGELVQKLNLCSVGALGSLVPELCCQLFNTLLWLLLSLSCFPSSLIELREQQASEGDDIIYNIMDWRRQQDHWQ